MSILKKILKIILKILIGIIAFYFLIAWVVIPLGAPWRGRRDPGRHAGRDRA